MTASWLVTMEPFLADQPALTMMASVIIQATLITVVAMLAAKLCARDAVWMHRIWMIAVSLMLLILPLHLSSNAWVVSLSKTTVAAAVTTNESVAPQASSNEEVGAELIEQSFHEVLTSDLSSNEQQQSPVPENAVPENTLNSNTSDLTASDLTASVDHVGFHRTTTPNTSQTSATPMAVLTYVRENWVTGSVFLYTVGVAISVLKLVLGACYLQRLYHAGTEVSPSTCETILSYARRLNLHRTPRFRLTQDLDMPLVYGIGSGVLLLPKDFANWPQSQQHTVLIHELLHVKRRDIFCELLSRLMRAFYWYHPAAWLVAKQVRVTRELATDQAVVLAGWDRHEYASGLVEVLRRIGANRTQNSKILTAVAMSGFAAIEQRLIWVMQSNPMQLSNMHGRLLAGLLLLFAAMTTIQFRWIQAEDQKVTTAGTLVSATNEIQPTDNDLYQRIKNCKVLNVTDDAYDAQFTVTGTVVSSEGKPVAGAIVILRESSSMRIRSDFDTYIYREDQDFVRCNDVFARTISNERGEFEINAARAPALPRDWTDTWNGDIIAAHEQLGLGWLPMDVACKIPKTFENVTIPLQLTTSISGRCIDPSGEPMANQLVQVQQLETGSPSFGDSKFRLDTSKSQLTPWAMTNEDGEFVFSGLPPSCIAIVNSCDSSDWVGSSVVAVRTSDDIPLGLVKDRGYGNGAMWSSNKEVVQSPAIVTADPGVHFRGKIVDDLQRPVGDVRVRYSTLTKVTHTNADGEFDLHLRSKALAQRDFGGANKVASFFLDAVDPAILPQTVELPLEQLRQRHQLQFTMNRGYRVTGEVKTTAGKPIEGIRVLVQPASFDSFDTVTDKNGRYDFHIPAGKHELVFASDVIGYEIPNSWDIRRGEEAALAAAPKRSVEINPETVATIPTIFINESAKQKFRVLLPDGSSASRASVLATNPRQLKYQHVSAFTANDAGIIELEVPPAGTQANVVAIYSVGEKSYSGWTNWDDSEKLDRSKPVDLLLQEDSLVRGRILVDGRPAAGAVVSVDVLSDDTKDLPPQLSQAAKLSERQTTSGLDGRWQIRMRKAERYAPRLQSVPGIDRMPTSFPVALKVAEGIHEVRDFHFRSGYKEIAGILVDSENAPIRNAWVGVKEEDGINPEAWPGYETLSQRETDAEGRFHLRKVPPGLYRLEVTQNGQGDPVSQFFEAETDDLNVRLVVDNRPLPPLPHLPAGKIVPLLFQEAGTGEGTPEEQPADVLPEKQPEPAEIKNPVEIRGFVVDDENHPIPGAKVKSIAIAALKDGAYRGFASHPQASKSSTTDDAGRFIAIAGEDIMQISFSVEASGFVPGAMTWNRYSKEENIVRMRRGAAVSGRLVGPSGPLVGLKLRLSEVNAGLRLPTETVSGIDGEFEFRDLQPEEEYALYTTLDSKSESVLPVSLLSTPGPKHMRILGDVPAQPSTELTITIQTLDQKPLPNDLALRLTRRNDYLGHTIKLPLTGDASQTILVKSAADDVVESAVLAKGYKVIRTIPQLFPTEHRWYPIRLKETSSITFVLVPDDN